MSAETPTHTSVSQTRLNDLRDLEFTNQLTAFLEPKKTKSALEEGKRRVRETE